MTNALNSITYNTNTDSFLIFLPEELRNSIWSNSWGSIQKKIRLLPKETKNIITSVS